MASPCLVTVIAVRKDDQAGGVERDVTVADATADDVQHAVDDAYRTKYGRYGSSYIRPMTAPSARATTLQLLSEK